MRPTWILLFDSHSPALSIRHRQYRLIKVRSACLHCILLLLVTELGVVGLCPKATSVGDVVAMIYRASVPCLLRHVAESESKAYNLIGGCYAHEYMDGKALELPIPAENFVLK